MAKKKMKKEVKKDTGIKIEIIGMLLILTMIIGLCQFGMLSGIINGFAAFLCGSAWAVLLILVGSLGGYMIVKRQFFDLLTPKMLGAYIIVTGILCLFHLGYINQLEVNGNIEYNIVIEETFNNLNNFIDGTADTYGTDLGGGMIGAVVCVSLVKLVSTQGTTVVSFILILIGFIILTGITLFDIANYLKEKCKSSIKNKPVKSKDKHIKTIEDDYENDTNSVKTNMEEFLKREEREDRIEYEKMHTIEEKNKYADPTKKYTEENDVLQTVKEPEQPKEEIETLELDEIKGIIKPTVKTVSDNDIVINNGKYQLPKISILTSPKKIDTKDNEAAVKGVSTKLQNVLKDFNITAKVVAANIGPTVTQYELDIKAGTKLSKIVALDKELALALAAKSVNIQAPIPGKSTVGIEIPNQKTSPVIVREILETVPKNMDDSKLLVTLGKDIMGKPIYCEINKTPHLLVAGSTGAGKSVCINSMLVSILMRAKPDEVKLVLVDPKKVELSIYNGVPHLLTPVVTDAKKANDVLKKIVTEMENRYELFERSGTKNIAGYNAYLEKQEEETKPLPYILVIIDELADLMLVAAKEVEESIMRITQMARAAGIHLIVATQRPSTDVITGVVKANIPSRISFAVSSSIDSRTIIDKTGAEKLLGKGDMLFIPQGENIPIRVQGTFISDEEIKDVVDYTISQQVAQYDATYERQESAANDIEQDATEEPLYNEIVEFVIENQKASASLLQRRFRLGYNRAARVVDLLEQRGIIGPSNGSKPREVLIKPEN